MKLNYQQIKTFVFTFIEQLSSSNISIKSLTLIGFSLVVFPLTIALLYSANQMNELSINGTSSILQVADIVENNRKLSESFNKVQRFGSQYVVLNEVDIYQQFIENKSSLANIIHENFSHNQQLATLGKDLVKHIEYIDKLMVKKGEAAPSLSSIQERFKLANETSQQLKLANSALINSHVKRFTASVSQVKSTILDSLLIIPLTLIIALIFIVLITRPLGIISKKIKRLELGHFQEKIDFDGVTELGEVADALELMRTRLHALELQKSSFIRHISHELKTPLAAIREGTELLYDHSVGDLNEEQQEISKIIKTSVIKLQGLIEDLLDFNIVLDSTSLQDAELVDISSLLNQCLELRSLDIKAKKLKITTELTTIVHKTNNKQLSVILDNLLSNAINYSPNQGIIHVTANVIKDELLITISDQGPGIEVHNQTKVFNAFYQGPPPENSILKSSGLGLTIVKELLMRLNGNIKLKNVAAPKHGLVITLSFPYQQCGKNIK